MVVGLAGDRIVERERRKGDRRAARTAKGDVQRIVVHNDELQMLVISVQVERPAVSVAERLGFQENALQQLFEALFRYVDGWLYDMGVAVYSGHSFSTAPAEMGSKPSGHSVFSL